MSAMHCSVRIGRFIQKSKMNRRRLYVKGCKVTNSLIADGCVIRGNVESSVIGRYVEIENDVTIHNCIILQNVRIHRNARLSNVIIDKNVDIDSRHGTERK